MQTDEKRREPRLRAFKAGRAVISGGYSTFDCTVRNLSAGGAKVVFENTADIPAHFRLRFEDGTSHDCEVRWRTPREVGVQFLDARAG
ncbi:pilus assembly protein PilZ [Rhizobium sp. Root274]|uniref:PilZ domain-containing protein n=1 Tax=unclassified Rhizobium TaxID=2613769 RepID=UPI0007140530|nr:MULTISPECIES: PilZ domain-containing protein [unclassified Rhizobium]KQW27435.1 pilus assembly protein PilZ [Rhizobium sp. Root1240]KRD27671.1 pilus assembly protein PilZ [Rhizobium sp. Root274]